MKFTFKNFPRPTGLARICARRGADIKLKKELVGSIQEEHFQESRLMPVWRVRFMVMKTEPDGDTNCNWKWISFKNTFESLDAAKTWVNSETFQKHLKENYTLRER